MMNHYQIPQQSLLMPQCQMGSTVPYILLQNGWQFQMGQSFQNMFYTHPQIPVSYGPQQHQQGYSFQQFANPQSYVTSMPQMIQSSYNNSISNSEKISSSSPQLNQFQQSCSPYILSPLQNLIPHQYNLTQNEKMQNQNQNYQIKEQILLGSDEFSIQKQRVDQSVIINNQIPIELHSDNSSCDSNTANKHIKCHVEGKKILFECSSTNQSLPMNQTDKDEIKVSISNNESKTKFKICKQKQSISQENLSSTYHNSPDSDSNKKIPIILDQDNFALSNQENFPINQEIKVAVNQENTFCLNEDILNHNIDQSDHSFEEKECIQVESSCYEKLKQINHKSRNFSKNLLKSFYKFTLQENQDDKRFLFNFKRYISSNKPNNDLIIKLMTNSPYHQYFIEYLGQPATDWIVNSKVQNIDEQQKFLELCRNGSVSALKKRSHNKKKNLFSMKKY